MPHSSSPTQQQAVADAPAVQRQDEEDAPPLLALLQASLPPGGSTTPDEEEEGRSGGRGPDGASPSRQTLEALQRGLAGEHRSAAETAVLLNGKPSPRQRKKERWGWLLGRFGTGGKQDGSDEGEVSSGSSASKTLSRTGSGCGGKQTHPQGSSVPDSVVLPGLPVVSAAGGSPTWHSRANSDAGPGIAASGHATPNGPPSLVAHPLGSSMHGSEPPSALSSLAPSPAPPGQPQLLASPAGTAALPPGIDAPSSSGKKHRRSHSLTAFLKMGRRVSRSAGSESELGGPIELERTHDVQSSGASRHATPHATPHSEGIAPTRSPASSLSCFGYTSRQAAGGAEGEEVISEPVAESGGAAGTAAVTAAQHRNTIPAVPLDGLPAGIKNTGNTCFVNAALQCLRCTPGLPLQLVPDLLAKVQRHMEEQKMTPRAAAVQGTAAAAVDDPAGAAQVVAPADSTQEALQTGQQVGDAGGKAGDPVEGSAEQGSGGGGVQPQADAVGQADQHAAERTPTKDASAEAPAAGQAAGPAAAEHASGEQQVAAPLAQPHAAVAPQPQPAARPAPPPRGAVLAAFVSTLEALYLSDGRTSVDPGLLLRTLRASPLASDYFDGGQHDCQEVLRVLMDLLHQDLNRVQPLPTPAAKAQAGAGISGGGISAGQSADAGSAEGPSAASGGTSVAEAQQVGGSSVPASLAVDSGGSSSPEQEEQQPLAGSSEMGAKRAVAPEVVPLQQGLAAGAGPAMAGAGQAEGRTKQESEQAEHAEEVGETEGQGGGERRKEGEGERADRFWHGYLERDSSPITDLFGGQLQSSVTCHKCGGRFTQYEPFWDLSLPLAKESKSSMAWLGIKGAPATIQDCLRLFTSDERLEGPEAFHCETCGEKTAATKHLRLHRLPEVLVLHIKRFQLKGSSWDKLSTNVGYPLHNLRLHSFLSPESSLAEGDCVYDLYAVSNHHGNLSGGHYTAMCCLATPGGGEAWYSFNDESVSLVKPDQVVSQSAYILFFARRHPAAGQQPAAARQAAPVAAAATGPPPRPASRPLSRQDSVGGGAALATLAAAAAADAEQGAQ